MEELPVRRVEEELKLFQAAFPNLPAEFKHLVEDDFELWFFNFGNYRFSIPLGEFKKHQATGLVRNFIYDRKLETVWLNFGSAQHPQFIACLYTLHHLTRGTPLPKDVDRTMTHFPFTYCAKRYDSLQDVAGQWLDECMGFYLSSVSKRIYKDKAFKLTRQEKIQFADYDFGDF